MLCLMLKFILDLMVHGTRGIYNGGSIHHDGFKIKIPTIQDIMASFGLFLFAAKSGLIILNLMLLKTTIPTIQGVMASFGKEGDWVKQLSSEVRCVQKLVSTIKRSK